MGIAVVVQDDSGHESYFVAENRSNANSNSSSGSIDSALASAPAVGSTAAESDLLKGLLPQTDGGGNAAAIGATGLGSGNAALPTGGSGGKVKTQVFGVEGEGSRFIYIFDRSDSMNGYEERPLKRCKQELLASLQSLGKSHQFQIIFYNDSPSAYGSNSRTGPRLLYGDDQTREQAMRFVKEMTATGGTQHVPALLMGLNMAPDVIFFLTDADDPPNNRDYERIIDLADRHGTTIHCIQFGSGNRSPRSEWISNMADQTRGKYRYVDVSLL
jgi:hypothetical protein